MYLIAEIGQAHDGSLGQAHSYIDALSKSNISAIKFQIHIADAESSSYEDFRVKFSYEDKTRFDYWKRMEFTLEQWKGLKQHCEDVNLDFIASPFSCKAVDLLKSINNETYKIGSGEVNNKLMIEKIAKLKRKMILSSGLSSISELKRAVKWIQTNECNDISILQCTTNYPTKPENWGLNVIKELKNEFKNIPIGFSDHSGTIYSGISAFLYGAEILEFHVAFDKRIFGPDSTSSLTIDEVTELSYAISMIKKSLQNPLNKNFFDENNLNKKRFGKSLSVNKDLNKGHVIEASDLETKKPFGKGISPIDYDQIIGKSINKKLKKNSFITKNDIVW